MPTPEAMTAAVHAYIEAFNRGDAQMAADLFADDATIEDPVGTPLKSGKAAILEFYTVSMGTGAKLFLEGPVRVGADCAAFPFQARLHWDGKDSTVDVIDVFRFNDDGKVIEMKAYFGPTNMG